jgi:hypothetical protein
MGSGELVSAACSRPSNQNPRRATMAQCLRPQWDIGRIVRIRLIMDLLETADKDLLLRDDISRWSSAAVN